MTVYVMSAEARSGVSKNNNKPYSGVFTDIVYISNGTYRVRTVFISANLFPEGVVPQYGDILNIEQDFGGYITSVAFVDNKKCSLTIMNAGQNNQGGNKQ